MYNLAILTTIFNHSKNPYFLSNWNEFTKSLRQRNLLQNLFVCEIISDCTQSQINSSEFNHWVVHNNSVLWHKESALNYLLSKIPSKYNGIIILDNDIIFEDENWYDQTSRLLDEHVAVQLYSKIDYLLSNNEDIELFDDGLVNVCKKSKIMSNGNPGLALAYRLDYLRHMDGFYDQCLVGGGDIINIAPFFISTHGILFNVFEMIPNDCQSSMINYILKGKKFINKQLCKPITFIKDSKIIHLFHGYWSDRKYDDRYSLINSEPINYMFKKNSLQFYETINIDIKKKLEFFFENRFSLERNSQPTIVCSSKYQVDNDYVLWLKPQSKLYFYNINKLELSLNKHQNYLGNIEILINDKPINIDQIINNNSQVLIYNNPKIISINCSGSVYAPCDERSLGLFINDIKITPSSTIESCELQKYKLSDVL